MRAWITALLKRFGFVPAKPAPDFDDLEAETARWVERIRQSSDKAEAVECAQAIAGIWRDELRRVV